MLNPGTIISSYVTALRAIPELVAEMGGDATRIIPFYGRIPDQASMWHAIYEAPRPSLLVVYQGFGPGDRRRNQMWLHRVSVIIRPLETADSDAPEDHLRALHLLVNGKPDGSPVGMLYYTVHADLDPMEVPAAARQTVIIDAQGTQLDYWQFDAQFPEAGDAQ